MSSIHHIEINNWQGPMDLLLELIYNAKVNIYDISITEITEKYLLAVDSMKKKNIEVSMSFIVMAATLIYLKSRMLLPTTFDEDEEDSQFYEINSKEKLINQLLEYQKYKEAAKKLQEKSSHLDEILEKKQRQTFLSFEKSNQEKYQQRWRKVEIFDLVKIFSNLMEEIEKKKQFDVFRKETFSIQDKKEMIKKSITQKNKIAFYLLFSNDISKLEVIVTFLAILELYKEKIIALNQEVNFGEIFIVAA